MSVPNWIPRGRQIIQGETPCCNGPQWLRHEDSIGGANFDADCLESGDYIMCPDHPDQVLYVFGTGDTWPLPTTFKCTGFPEGRGPIQPHEVTINWWSYAG